MLSVHLKYIFWFYNIILHGKWNRTNYNMAELTLQNVKPVSIEEIVL